MCERGQRFEALRTGRRTGRVNMLAAYCERQLSAAFTVDVACIELRSARGVRAVFETWLKKWLEKWLEKYLLPTLKSGQVVILDNATFHHGGQITPLLASVGCRLLYLPPYSPDLNRIEKCWAWLKSRIRKRFAHADTLRQAMESVLKEAVS